MRLRICLRVATAVLILSAMASAAEPGMTAPIATRHSNLQNATWACPLGSPYSAPSLLAQGWPNHGYPFGSFGSHSAQPYNYSSTFPYLYFNDQYAREAEESRRAADEFEASLAREGKLTGPAKVGAFLTDYLPRPPRDVALTLDGQPVSPSPSGGPLVIESGEHTLHIPGKPASVQTSR